MKKISQSNFAKLQLQVKEASTQARATKDEEDRERLKKVASNLTKELSETTTRSDNEFYTYSSAQLAQDVESALWKAALRISDYFDSTLDGAVTNEVIERYADNLIDEIRIKLGNEHGVGAYEPRVPGEEEVYLEVE